MSELAAPPPTPPSQSAPAAAPSTPEPVSYATPARKRLSLLQVAGALGTASFTVVVLLFLLACFGLNAAFRGFPYVPLICAIAGIVLAFVGGVRRVADDEDTHILFGLFVNGVALASAVLELAIGKNWTLF